MLRFVSVAACAALLTASPAFAQSADEQDGELDLESVDSLFGGSAVTGGDDNQDEAAAEDAAIVDSEDAPAEGELSDLDRAFFDYSNCASEAGAEMEEAGMDIDVIGQEALLRCAGQRAAYTNAFYFSLLPRYPDTPETEVRGVADRLVRQSDAALMNIVTGEVREARNARPDEDSESSADE